MRILSGSYSVGSETRSPSINQDAVGSASLQVFHPQGATTLSFFCVADGMGALDAPEEASSLAVKTALTHLISSASLLATRLSEALVKANQRLLSQSAGRDLGATLTCIGITDNRLFFAHLGDARLLHYSQGATRFLTEDHSKLAEHLKTPNPSIEDVKRAATSRKVTKSLGEREFEETYVMTAPSTDGISLRSGDYLVLCTDGVWTELTINDIAEIITARSASDAARLLCEAAICRDPSDDVSAIVVHAI